MSFWTSQQLRRQLPSLIENGAEDPIDCNAIRLRIGQDVYVSPTDQDPNKRFTSVKKLAPDEAFTIPPGQFGLLTTEEVIRVPADSMAFISIRAKIKFRGLINVSGFHVDPGYHGPLTFSVFNAGPSPVHLKRGQDCFLIWYASLAEESENQKTSRARVNLTDLVNAIPNEVHSLEGLNSKILAVESKLEERINRLDPKVSALTTKASVIISLFIALLFLGLRILGAIPSPFEP